MDLALAEEQKSLINSSSEDARHQKKLFKRKHPVLSLEQTDEFNLNKKFAELQSKTPSSQKTFCESKHSSKKTPKGGPSFKKTSSKTTSQNTPNQSQYKKQRIESDDKVQSVALPVRNTQVYSDSNSDSSFDIERRCVKTLKKIDHFPGNFYRSLIVYRILTIFFSFR